MEKKELKKKIETTYLDIAIPSNVENLQLPDPTLLQFYKNYDDRIIWIDDEITTMTLEYAKMIMQWNSEDKKNNIPAEERKPIKVIFFSPGGDLEVNNCLVDTIQLSQTKVIGINVDGEDKQLSTLLRDFADLPVEINIKVKDEEELDEPVDVE